MTDSYVGFAAGLIIYEPDHYVEAQHPLSFDLYHVTASRHRYASKFDILQEIVALLRPLNPEVNSRIIQDSDEEL